MTLYLYPKFSLVFFFTGKYKKRLSVCGRGVEVELLKRLGLFCVRSNSAFTRCMVSKVG